MDRTAARRLLVADRESTRRQVASLTREFDGIVEASQLVATDDEHDPEGATIAFERQQVAALLEGARTHLAEVDDALERLHQGRYGTCEQCRVVIPPERLVARPGTRTCVRCASGMMAR